MYTSSLSTGIGISLVVASSELAARAADNAISQDSAAPTAQFASDASFALVARFLGDQQEDRRGLSRPGRQAV